MGGGDHGGKGQVVRLGRGRWGRSFPWEGAGQARGWGWVLAWVRNQEAEGRALRGPRKGPGVLGQGWVAVPGAEPASVVLGPKTGGSGLLPTRTLADIRCHAFPPCLPHWGRPSTPRDRPAGALVLWKVRAVHSGQACSPRPSHLRPSVGYSWPCSGPGPATGTNPASYSKS